VGPSLAVEDERLLILFLRLSGSAFSGDAQGFVNRSASVAVYVYVGQVVGLMDWPIAGLYGMLGF
jgi:hypothetical protein